MSITNVFSQDFHQIHTHRINQHTLGASFIVVGYTIRQSMGLPFDLWPKMTTNLVLTQTHPCSLWRESTTINSIFFLVETINLLVLTQNQFPIKKNSEPILHKQRPSRLPAPPWPTSRESSDLCRGGLIRREKTEVQVGEQFCQRREKTEYKMILSWFDDVMCYCSSLLFSGSITSY